jgi:glycosyltransferase involved in cell wall biosynthesis
MRASDRERSGLPSVTVLIPTYERAGCLEQAIDSVLAQDYEALELLVLDDGSTDGTPEILERYAREHPPERFRWTRHDNVGQARTLNRGFELAGGELVGYLSSDDALLPGAVPALAAAFVAEPEVVVAYPAWEYIDAGGERIDTVMPEEFTLLHAIRASDPVIGPGALLRRSAIDKVGGWDPGIVYSADFEFWTRVSTLGPFRRVAENLAQYRWHEGMTGRSSTGIQIARERVAIVDRVYAGADLPPELLAVEAEAYRSAYLAGAGLLGGNAPWERFFLGDRLVSRTFPERRQALAATSAKLRARAAELENELQQVGGQIAALGDTLARREMEIASREAGA